jgi:outer membrane receptor protein involved in Fe transport
MKISITILFTTLLLSINAQQKGSYTGKLVDQKSKTSIPYSKIFILNPVDSTLITGGLTDEKGNFNITPVKFGDYIVKITAFGFKTLYIPDLTIDSKNSSITAGDIELSEDIELLNTVEVLAEETEMQTAIDKKIFNVEKQITATGGTALDALQNVPSITVDMDGNVSLRGSANVTVLIDGRPSSITGGDRSGVLETIPASSIQNIEIITNPSAKYDPDGMSGIINIVLKKNKLKGINGNIEAGIGTGVNYNGSLNLAYRNEKFNIYGGYSINHYAGYRNFNQTTETWSDLGYNKLIQSRSGDHLKHSNLIKFGTDFYLNDKNTLGFGVTGNIADNNRTGDMIYKSYDSTKLNNTWRRLTDDPQFRQGGDVKIFYEKKFVKKNQKLTADANYSIGESLSEGFYSEDSLSNNGQTTFPNFLKQTNTTPTEYSKSNFQVDYFYPIRNGKIETGLKSSFRTNNQSFSQNTFNSTINDYQEDTLLTNTFNYAEQVHGAYFIYGLYLDKIKFQIGLRAEQVFVDTDIKEDTLEYKNDYFSLYPSAHIKKPLGNNKELSLSYSRRVNRPRSHSLNPFPKYTDPLNLRRGNPYLNPEYINSVEFGYSSYGKKLTLNGSLYYRYMTDMIQRVKTIEDNLVSVTSWGNLDEGHFLGLEAVVIYKPKKWWRIMISTNLSQNYLKSDDVELNNSGFSYTAHLSQTFSLKNNWSIQHTGFFNSPRILSQGKTVAMYATDLAVKKSILKKKLTFSLRVSDIFNTRRFALEVGEDQVFKTESEWKWESRRLFFAVSYKFGKQSMPKAKRQGSGGGMDM